MALSYSTEDPEATRDYKLVYRERVEEVGER
jgi:hypothetical protein